MLWFAHVVRELQEAGATIALEISRRNSRVAALQRRWDRLRARPRPDPRPARRRHGRRLPGGASGLLCRDYESKKADRLATRIDPGAVSLVAELRDHERQAAEELGQWKTVVEEPKPSTRRRRQSDVASPQPPARHGEPTQVFAANAVDADGRPRMDGVIGWSQIRAVAKECDARPISIRRRWYPSPRSLEDQRLQSARGRASIPLTP